MSALLSFEDFRLQFCDAARTTDAVRSISFDVSAGEVVALVGESGSGKSVSALSCMRLLDGSTARYPSGAIRWQGEDILTMNKERLLQLRGNEIGMVFQEPMSALNPVMTCGEQVDEALFLHTSLLASQRRERVIELFQQVQLAEPERRIDQYPHELSGGMRQRVCIAIALACDPELLIADEPTTALDVTVQAQILELLRGLQKQRGMAVLFITHDLGVVADIADRVVIMWRGEKVEEGPVQHIFDHPQHPYTKGLLRCRPTLSSVAKHVGKRQRLPTIADFLP